MKKISLLILLITVSLNYKAIAQETSLMADVDNVLLDKYIQSAKDNYPRVKMLQLREKSAKAAIPNNAMSYLEIFNASYIFRPNSATAIASPGVGANPYSVNGFQFGLNLSLGQMLEKPFIGKKARADYDATRYETLEYLSTLELDVKKRYYLYIQQKRTLKSLTENVEDSRVISETLSDKFQKGQGITLETYTAARANLTAARAAVIQCEANLLLAQASLEEIVGKKLSDFQ